MFTIRFIKAWWLNRKYTRMLKKVYRQEDLLQNLSELFGTTFKMDWIGRVYTVFNPYIKDGKYDVSDIILDPTGDEHSEIVNHILMNKLNIARNYIRTRNLFDMLTYKLKKLDDYGNYLFVMIPITIPDLFIATKRMMWEWLVIAVLIGGYFAGKMLTL